MNSPYLPVCPTPPKLVVKCPSAKGYEPRGLAWKSKEKK